MTYFQPVFGRLLQTTLIASVVICLILLIQKMLGGKLGPRWCHALWLVLLIRMILPWAPSSRLSLLNLIPSWDQQIIRRQRLEPAEQQKVSPAEQTTETSEAIISEEPESETATQEQAAPKPRTLADVEAQSRMGLSSIRRVLPILWLAGAMVIGAYLLVSNFALWRIVKRDRPLVKQAMLELFEECKALMGVQSLVVVVPSDQVRSPGLFGFVRPRLLLPREMLDNATRQELQYVFLHELAHLKRRDIYLGWLTSLLQVLHWFNPLVWFAFYRMRADRELACDALVLTRTGQDKSQEYGGAIVGLVRRFSRSRPLPAMAGVIESKSQLKRRIAMITKFKNNSYRWSPLAVILIVILACVSLPDAKRTKASETSAAKPSAIVVRRVWAEAPNPFYTGAPSPDGKYLAYSDWDGLIDGGPPLAVLELATGKTRRLTETGSWTPFSPIFSPDSKQVAYAWHNPENQVMELRIVGLDGSEPRVLHSNREDQVQWPADWSADGQHILAVLYRAKAKESVYQIALVNVSDGSVRVVKTFDTFDTLSMLKLSPDGRYIAYSHPSAEGSSKADIFLLTTDGTRETALIEHPADDCVLGWAPDGKRLVFTSDRTGSIGVWVIGVADGKPQGTPELVKPRMEKFYPLGFTRNGSLYYAVSTGRSDVHIATLDPETGKLLGQPVKAIQRFEGYNSAPEWSPDGRYLVCQSSRAGAGDPPWAGVVLIIRELESGKVRMLEPECKRLNPRSLRWSPNGQSIIGFGLDNQGRQGLLQIDVQTEAVTALAYKDPNRGGGILEPAWAPDGKAVFYVRDHVGDSNSTEPRRIVRRELATGEETELCRIPGRVQWLAPSPDGRHLAFYAGSAVKLVSTTGGQPRKLAEANDNCGITWTPDGRYLLFGRKIKNGDNKLELWRISAQGGEPQKTGLTFDGWNVDVRMHPDGRRIAFASKQVDKNEVWAMENFLPAMSVAKPPGMVVRRVWANAWDPRFTGAPSPDGKYLSYVNWNTGDLAIHELASGTNRQLTNEGWDKGFALNSVFSPDSKQVAYYWWSNEKESGQLRIVGLDGSEPRVINRDNENAEFPTGWTPDGKHILTLGRNEDKSLQISLVPLEGGPVRILKTLRKRLPRGQRRTPGFCLSPDGRYVAYTFLPGEDSANGDISVLSVDGSRDIPLVEHPSDDFVLGWAPDGRGVVFASDRTGSMGIWAVEIAEGKPQGTPHLLKPEISQFHPMGFTQNGSYYYGVASMGNNVYVAEYDPQKGNVTGKPVLTVKHYEGSNVAPDWSPDGRYLACLSMRPEGLVFLIHSVETGQVRELSTDLKDFNVHSLRWSADGRFLLGAGKTEDVFWGVLKIDVETGAVTPIVEGPGIFGPNWSADGKVVFYVRRDTEGWQILSRDLTTNEEKDLFRATVDQPGVSVGGILGLVLSPDGKQLAFQDLDAGVLKVLSLEGGQPRELVKFEGKATIAWTPDGSHLLYANRMDKRGRLLRVSADGGEPQKLDLEMAFLNHVRFHPDGRQITFTSSAEDKIEVWVMENFLPEDLGK